MTAVYPTRISSNRTNRVRAAIAAMLASASIPAPLCNAEETVASVCRLSEAVTGFIVEIDPRQNRIGLTPAGSTEPPVPVPAHCYLRSGDLLETPDGTTAKVKLSTGDIETIHERSMFPVPRAQPPSLLTLSVKALVNLLPSDNAETWNLAHARVAASRDLHSMLTGGTIALLGVAAPATQTVAAGEPLLLRWEGGRPPFHVALASAGGSPAAASESAARNAQLDLSAFPPGTYDLTISGVAGSPLKLPLRLVTSTQVPTAPNIGTVSDPHGRALLQSVWLLTRGDPTWRLAALSGLYQLAAENDLIAQSIVGVPETAVPAR